MTPARRRSRRLSGSSASGTDTRDQHRGGDSETDAEILELRPLVAGVEYEDWSGRRWPTWPTLADLEQAEAENRRVRRSLEAMGFEVRDDPGRTLFEELGGIIPRPDDQ